MKITAILFTMLALIIGGKSHSQSCYFIQSDPEYVNGHEYTLSNGELIFSGIGQGWVELWKSDGTEAGTVRIKDILPGGNGSSPKDLTDVNGTVFFSADDGTNGRELWKSDGTEAGTVMVKNIHVSAGSSVSNIINMNGTAFFTADDGSNGMELWKSDGTDAGTVMVKDIHTTGSGSPSNLTIVNGTLFFTANDGTNGTELWKSDGTNAGTIMVKDILVSGSSDPGHLVEMNGTLYFIANDGVNGLELWKSDGTDPGTIMVKDIHPPGSGHPEFLINSGGVLFFRANDGVNGSELWKSDGSGVGTVMVKDICSGCSSNPQSFYYVNGITFFMAYQTGYGSELWKTDGTDAGTTLVKDFNPGVQPGNAQNFIAFNNRIYFMGVDDINGAELWQTDGTEAGTFLLHDIYPGSDSYPQKMIVYNNMLIFNARDDDGEAMRVLHSMPTTSSSSISASPVSGGTQTLYWANGDGGKRIVVARENTDVSFIPQNTSTYTANASFGSGTDVGSGEYVVYDGTGNSVTVTGLTDGNTYHYSIYEYNGESCPSYLAPGESYPTISGILEMNVKNGFKLYPNPATSSDEIRVTSMYAIIDSLQLYNAQGSLMRESISGNMKLTDLSPGLYVLKVNSEKNAIHTTLVIK